MDIPPMKSGFSNLLEPPELDPIFLQNVHALLFTLLEKAMTNAAFYANEANRDIVTPGDIKIALMFEAHEFWNRDDIEEKVQEYKAYTSDDDDSDDDPDEIEEVEDVEFSRATTLHPKTITMNHYYDSWSSWEPTDPTVIALKNAIDSKFIDI